MGLQKIVGCLHQGEEGEPQDYGHCYTCTPNEKNRGCTHPYVSFLFFYVYPREEIKTLETTKKEKEKILA